MTENSGIPKQTNSVNFAVLLPGINPFVIAGLLIFIFLLTAGSAGAADVPKQPKGYLIFRVDPKTAESVILKGDVEVARFKGRAKELALPPGQYRLLIRAKGRQTLSSPFKIRPGKITNLSDIRLLFPNGQWAWDFVLSGVGGGKSAIIVGDRVCLLDGDGSIYCLELNTGKRVWKTPANKKLTICCCSIAANRSHIFVVSDKENLLCFSLNSGDKVWEYKITRRHRYWPYDLIPTEKYVYLCAEGRLDCIDAKTGRLRWWKTGVKISCYSAGNIYVSNLEGDQITRYDASRGRKKFTISLPKTNAKNKTEKSITDPFPLPLIFENKLFVVDAVTGKTLYCYDTNTGKLKWKYRRKAYISPLVAISNRTRCAYLLTISYVEDRYFPRVRLYCLDVDSGRKRWIVKVDWEELSLSISPPIVAGDNVYLSRGNNFLCYDARTGALKLTRTFKKLTPNEGFHSMFAASGDKLIFSGGVTNKNGQRIRKAICIQIENTGPGDWTTMHGNPSRSNTKTMPDRAMPRK